MLKEEFSVVFKRKDLNSTKKIHYPFLIDLCVCYFMDIQKGFFDMYVNNNIRIVLIKKRRREKCINA